MALFASLISRTGCFNFCIACKTSVAFCKSLISWSYSLLMKNRMSPSSIYAQYGSYTFVNHNLIMMDGFMDRTVSKYSFVFFDVTVFRNNGNDIFQEFSKHLVICTYDRSFIHSYRYQVICLTFFYTYIIAHEHKETYKTAYPA